MAGACQFWNDVHNGGSPSPNAVWAQLCSHIDGIAIGTTVSALLAAGVFERLASAARPLPISALAIATGLNNGYFHVAVRLLEFQGLVHRTGELDRGGGEVELSGEGRRWLAGVSRYAGMTGIVRQALDVPACLERRQPWDGVVLEHVLSRGTSHVDAVSIDLRIARQLQGPLVAAVMRGLAQRGALDFAAAPERHDAIALDVGLAGAPSWDPAWRLLEAQGWIARDAAALRWTEAGRLAARMAAQYWVPLCYLPTFLRISELLRGGFATPAAAVAATAPAAESHLDRKLDIEASGRVFTRICRPAFLEIVLPLFDTPELDRQPVAIVDTGSGDGTLLAELHAAIAANTHRGRHLSACPLLMVGAEFNAVALEATASRLAAAGVPHQVFFGDIGDPAAIAAELRRRGIDPLQVLHVGKSVIHNRRYRSPVGHGAEAGGEPGSEAVFVDEQGNLVSAFDLERNLVEHFEAWRPWIGRHGMVVIEAHAVSPKVAARSIGRQVLTGVEACHGYSRQYLVEAHVYRRAAAAAGLAPLAARDLVTQLTGQPLLTIDHWR